jgi:hypothetical protein
MRDEPHYLKQAREQARQELAQSYGSEQGDVWKPPAPSVSSNVHDQGGDPEPVPKVETFTAAQLLAMDLPEPRFAVQGVVPEGLTILAGKPKLGKSWLALNLALAVATGGVALGEIHVEQGDVLYLALEDNKRRLQDRLRKLLDRQDVAPPERLTLAREWPRQNKGGLDAIGEWVDAHKEARLVIIDTWARFKPPRFGRSNEYEEDYRHGGEVKSLADRHGVAILTLHHCRKMAAADPLEEVSGTLGLTGVADGVLVLRRERGEADASLFVTGRDLEEQDLALHWDAQFALWSVAGHAEEFRVSKQRKEVLTLLAKAGKPLSPSEAAPLLGKKPNAVKKLLWTMAQTGQLTQDHGRYAVASGNLGNPGNHSENQTVTETANDGNPEEEIKTPFD